MSASNPQDTRLDHVVVIMFENRSFDNLLGYLFRTGKAPPYEGVQRPDLSNPVPPYAEGAGSGRVIVHPATNMAAPYPDPGEEYPHVNTQLFGSVEPETNRFAKIVDMKAPFNAPASGDSPSMDGFVMDYVNELKVEWERSPSAAEYSQIMSCYTPDQLPVLSGLALGFTFFDHWFCEVPSQTYCNRSFFHAATSSGYVLNGHPAGKFSVKNDARTVFNQLEDARRTWAVYIDPLQFLPATGLIHARQLWPYFGTHFRTIYDFYFEAAHGVLPSYSFIEPNMFHPHTDMHPHSGSRLAEKLGALPDTIIGGERLLARVYNSVRSSASVGGSNWENTALLITFDEHGGTFDHVPPPAAVPPDSSPIEESFPFDRLGVRIPTVLVSAWVEGGHVVADPFRSTSMIRTLRDWWNLGPPLTLRDADAPSLISLLTRSSPRNANDWPDVEPCSAAPLERMGEEFLREFEDLHPQLERLERDLLGDALAHEARVKGTSPAADSETVSHEEAHQHFRRIRDTMFHGIATGKTS
ncbi:MAG: alkaline phosphatase family protein [Thermoplasmata archaeon]